MKKLSTYEKNVITWEKRDVWMDVVLMAFDKSIQYDYPIPDLYRTNNHVISIINELKSKKKIPSNVADKILKHCWASKDEYSNLETRLTWNHIFGSEWFYGFGTLYRWRSGEKEKAQVRIDKYIPKSEKKFIPIIQDSLKLKTDKVEPFELDKAIKS
jgi:hypothetical protein